MESVECLTGLLVTGAGVGECDTASVLEMYKNSPEVQK